MINWIKRNGIAIGLVIILFGSGETTSGSFLPNLIALILGVAFMVIGDLEGDK